MPLESGYFEAYNRPNVRLVDINETPTERITPRGVKTSAEEHEFDILIYATGFDGEWDRSSEGMADRTIISEGRARSGLSSSRL